MGQDGLTRTRELIAAGQTRDGAACACGHAAAQHRLHPRPCAPPAGLGACGKQGLKLRFGLVQYAVQQLLAPHAVAGLVPFLVKQALQCMAQHRHDAAGMAALAELLAAVTAQLLQRTPSLHDDPPQLQEHCSCQWLCRELLFPILKSTYRQVEQPAACPHALGLAY